MMGSSRHSFHVACVFLAILHMGGGYDSSGCYCMVAPLPMMVVAAFDMCLHGHAVTGWAH